MGYLDFNKIPTEVLQQILKTSSSGNPNDLTAILAKTSIISLGTNGTQMDIKDTGNIFSAQNNQNNAKPNEFNVDFNTDFEDTKAKAQKTMHYKIFDVKALISNCSSRINRMRGDFQQGSEDETRRLALQTEINDAETKFKDALGKEETEAALKKNLENSASPKDIEDILTKLDEDVKQFDYIKIIDKKASLLSDGFRAKEDLTIIQAELSKLKIDKNTPSHIKEKYNEILKNAKENEKAINEHKDEAFKDGKTPEEIDQIYNEESKKSSDLRSLEWEAEQLVDKAEDIEAQKAIDKSIKLTEPILKEMQKAYDSIPDIVQNDYNGFDFNFNARREIKEHIDQVEKRLNALQEGVNGNGDDETTTRYGNEVKDLKAEYDKKVKNCDGEKNIEFSKNIAEKQKTVAKDNLNNSFAYLNEDDLITLDNSRLKIQINSNAVDPKIHTKIYQDKSGTFNSAINIPLKDVSEATTPLEQVKLAAKIAREITHAEDIGYGEYAIDALMEQHPEREKNSVALTAGLLIEETSIQEESDALGNAIGVIQKALADEKITKEEAYKAISSLGYNVSNEEEYMKINNEYGRLDIVTAKLKKLGLKKGSLGHEELPPREIVKDSE